MICLPTAPSTPLAESLKLITEAMGRVARYKKVKSVDPFAKARTWTDDVGNTSNIRRTKKRSKTAQKLKDQKNKHRRGKKSDKNGNDDGFDLPPDGGDEFDMNDLMGSVKKQKVKPDELLKGANPILDNVTKKSDSSSLSSKVEKVDSRGVNTTPKQTESNNTSNQSKKNAAAAKSSSKGLENTAHTPTREIIAACDNPKTQKETADGTNSKQAKRKAFFEQKKLKKKNKRMREEDYDDVEYDSNEHITTSSKQSTKAPIARSVVDDQVERPPIFSTLPRGAISKKKKDVATKKNGDKDDKIKREQQALEAMRQRVMAQYAILRESRRR